MPPIITLIVRRMPKSQNAWLRFQCGFIEKRFEQLALYERRHDARGMPYEQFMGFVPSKKQADVFHLLGYGETQERAEAMAHINLARLPS